MNLFQYCNCCYFHNVSSQYIRFFAELTALTFRVLLQHECAVYTWCSLVELWKPPDVIMQKFTILLCGASLIAMLANVNAGTGTYTGFKAILISLMVIYLCVYFAQTTRNTTVCNLF